MGELRVVFDKVWYLCQLRMKAFYRRHSPLKFLVGMLFVFIYFLFFGILLVIAFLGIFSQDVDFKPPVAYRDLLVFGFIVFFATGLSYLVAAGATGLRNPYIGGRQDVHFFQRIPVESSVMYLGARLTESLKVVLVVVPSIVCLFGPLMLVLHLPWWRMVGVLIVCLLTFNLCGNIADLAFFTFRRFRRKNSWYQVWLDSSSPLIGIILLWVPVLAFLMYQQQVVPDFETLSDFLLIPLINTAVIATSFFFRSGVPWQSWIGLIILISESIIIAGVTSIIAAYYKPMEDMAEIIPVLSFQAAKLEDFIGGKTIQPPELIDSDIKGNSIFTEKSPWFAYLLKDWLAIKRIRAFRKHFFLAPIIVIGLTIVFLFIPQENSLFFALQFFVIYPMADFLLLLIQLEIKDPMQRFTDDRWNMVKSKFILALFVIGFYSVPLFVAKGLVSLIIILLVTALVTIVGKTKWGALKSRYFLLLGIVLLTTPLILLS